METNKLILLPMHDGTIEVATVVDIQPRSLWLRWKESEKYSDVKLSCVNSSAFFVVPVDTQITIEDTKTMLKLFLYRSISIANILLGFEKIFQFKCAENEIFTKDPGLMFRKKIVPPKCSRCYKKLNSRELSTGRALCYECSNGKNHCEECFTSFEKKEIFVERKCRFCDTINKVSIVSNIMECAECNACICACCLSQVDPDHFKHGCKMFYEVNNDQVTLEEAKKFLNWTKYDLVIVPELTKKNKVQCGVGKRISLTRFVWKTQKSDIIYKVCELDFANIHHYHFVQSSFLLIEDILPVCSNPYFRHLALEPLMKKFDNSFSLKHSLIIEKKLATKKECCICMDSFVESNLRKCDSQENQHFFCEDCLVHTIRSKSIQQADLCCAPDCTSQVDIFNLKQLSDDWYTKYACKDLIMKECAWCHTASYVTSLKEIHHYFECPQLDCGQLTCGKCDSKFHGKKPCELQSTTMQEFKQISENAGVLLSQCPSCKSLIEVDKKFCNKIICGVCLPNQVIFCACCSKKFSSETTCYNHFCRSTEQDPVCSKSCLHCFLWPSKEAQSRAAPEFLNKFPQFQ